MSETKRNETHAAFPFFHAVSPLPLCPPLVSLDGSPPPPWETDEAIELCTADPFANSRAPIGSASERAVAVTFLTTLPTVLF